MEQLTSTYPPRCPFWILLSCALLLWACSPSEKNPNVTKEEIVDRHLDVLYWQAPSTLNPYLSGGTKDMEAASMIIEPLAHFDENGQIVPTLAQEIPSFENGGLSEDHMSITWKLLPNVTWSDSTPFTAEDVKFTADYCMNDEMGCNALVEFQDIDEIVVIDELTVQLRFKKPKPHPFDAFVGSNNPILQKAQFENCTGLRAQECTEQNFGPIGTGPFKIVEFRANDVATYVANENYRESDKPYFQTATIKGGGDAASAARAVLATGEYDYAWNLQVEPEILTQMSQAGYGEIVTGYGSQIERLMLNFTNANSALDLDKRSVYMDGNNPHPFITDFNVRKALSLAIDRNMLVEHGYGAGGAPACNVVPAPLRFRSPNNDSCTESNVELANQLLDEAGWIRGDDGVREKDGVKLSILFQTSTNTVRQGTQALIKQMWSAIGVETELRNIDGAVFFGGDPASPDTLQKFYSDVEMYTNAFLGNDPESYLANFTCDQITSPKNDWLGTNVNRACTPEYDKIVTELSITADPQKREELAILLNDTVIQNYWLIPLIHRASLSARLYSLGGVRMNGWDSELWNVADWYRIEANVFIFKEAEVSN